MALLLALVSRWNVWQANVPMRVGVLPPASDYVIKIDSDGGKNISADSYVPPFLDEILVYDNIKCDTLTSGATVGKGEGPAGIQNYQSRKTSER